MTEFHNLLNEMETLHEKKSADYASPDNPCGNYYFASMCANLFAGSIDISFVGRLGEKLYRLANLENEGKIPRNESIEDTELDLCVIMLLWISDRRERRAKKQVNNDMAKETC